MNNSFSVFFLRILTVVKGCFVFWGFFFVRAFESSVKMIGVYFFF